MTASDIFISYNRADAAVAAALHRILANRGLAAFLDSESLPLGRSWPERLETSLGGSRVTLVLIGPHGLGHWQRREIDLALDLQLQSPARQVIPVLLPGADPAIVPGFLKLNTWLDLRQSAGTGTADEWDALASILLGQQPAVPVAPVASDICPYAGIHAFTEDEEAFFWGRQAQVDTIVTKILSSPVTCIVGPSGIGKSSVVNAGVVPKLRRMRSPEPVWDICRFTPGRHPYRQLADALVRLMPEGADAGKLAKDLKDNDGELDSAVPRIRDASNGVDRLLVIVDQLEELFTHTLEADRAPFIAWIVAAARANVIRVVVTLRADFYGDALALHPDLAAALAEAQVPLGPMRTEDLRKAIEEPAKQVGLAFELNLVDLILQSVVDRPGSLPLLEYALTALWNERRGNLLTKAAYDHIGGVEQALAARATRVTAAMAEEDVYYLFQRLIRVGRPGDEGGDVRRRAAKGEFPPRVWDLALRFAQPDTRLLVFAQDSRGAETVEVAHEALIRHWDRWKDWIAADRDFLLFRQRLEPFVETDADLPELMRTEARRWYRDRRNVLFSDAERRLIERTLHRSIWSTTAFKVAAVAAVVIAVVAVFGWRKLSDDASREEARKVVKEATAQPLNWPRSDPHVWTGQDEALWSLPNLPVRTKRWIAREILENEWDAVYSADRSPLSLVTGLDLRQREEILEPVLRERCREGATISETRFGTCVSMLEMLPSAPSWAGGFLADQLSRRSAGDGSVTAAAAYVMGAEGIATADLDRITHELATHLVGMRRDEAQVLLPGSNWQWTTMVSALTSLRPHLTDQDRAAVTDLLLKQVEKTEWVNSAMSQAKEAVPFAGAKALDAGAARSLTLLEKNKDDRNPAAVDSMVDLCKAATAPDLHARWVAYLVKALPIAYDSAGDVMTVADSECLKTLSSAERESLATAVLAGTPEGDKVVPPSTDKLVKLADLSPAVAKTAISGLLLEAKTPKDIYARVRTIQTLVTLGSHVSKDDAAAAGEILLEGLRKLMADGPQAARIRMPGRFAPVKTGTVSDIRPTDANYVAETFITLGPNAAEPGKAAASLMLKQVEGSSANAWEYSPAFEQLLPYAEKNEVQRYGDLLLARLKGGDQPIIGETLSVLAIRIKALEKLLPALHEAAMQSLLAKLHEAAKKVEGEYRNNSISTVVNALRQLDRSDTVNSEITGVLMAVHARPAPEVPNPFESAPDSDLLRDLFAVASVGDPRVVPVAEAHVRRQLADGTMDENYDGAVRVMDTKTKRKVLVDAVKVLGESAVPACGMVADLADGEPDIPTALDVLKWPSCRGGTRQKLELRVVTLMGQSTESVRATVVAGVTLPGPTFQSQNFVMDDLKFLRLVNDWAKTHGYDLSRPLGPHPPSKTPVNH